MSITNFDTIVFLYNNDTHNLLKGIIILMEQLNSRKIQAQKTKERIISATSELLKEKTLDEINVTDICKSADVSVGAFYHHFQNKEFIIIELYTTIDLYFETHVYPYFSKKQPEVEDLVEYLAIQCDYAIRMGIALVQNAYKAQINYGNEFFCQKIEVWQSFWFKLLIEYTKINSWSQIQIWSN